MMKRRLNVCMFLAMLVLNLWVLAFRLPTPPETSGIYAESALSDHAVGWVVGSSVDGYGSIVHTRDGGQNWVRQGDTSQIPDVYFEGVWAVDRYTAWVVGGPDNGYGVILRTDDGGQTWERQGSSAEIPNVELTDISAVDANTAWACGGVLGGYGTILCTVDGGLS